MGATGAVALIMGACGYSPGSTPASATLPAGLSVSFFHASFFAMAQLQGLTAGGRGRVGVRLPDQHPSTTEGLHAERRRGYRSECRLIRPGLQLRDLG